MPDSKQTPKPAETKTESSTEAEAKPPETPTAPDSPKAKVGETVRICWKAGNSCKLFGLAFGERNPQITVEASRVKRFGISSDVLLDDGADDAKIQADREANELSYQKVRQLLASGHLFLVLADGSKIRKLDELLARGL